MQIICILINIIYIDKIMKITKLRKQIISVLNQSCEALSAADIHRVLPHINLVTIYRNLDNFTSEGLIKKLQLVEQESVYEIQHEPHHHAICDECKKIIHFSVKDNTLLKSFSLPEFDIYDLEFVVKGKCRAHSKNTKA